MSLTLKDLKEEMGKTYESFKEHNDKSIKEAEERSGVATAETRAIVDTLNNDITELKKKLEDAELRAQRPPKQDDQGNDITPEMEMRNAVLEKYVRYGADGHEWKPEERAALSATADNDGQFLVPDDWETEILMNSFKVAKIRPYCDLGTTSRDNVKMGSVSKPIVSWGTKGLKVPEQQLHTGGIDIPIKNIYGLTLLHNDTLSDTASNVMSKLNMGFQKAINVAEDQAFVAGVDPDGPAGILTYQEVLDNAVNSGVAAGISDTNNNGIDAIIDMIAALPEEYQDDAVIAMSRLTEASYRKLKDSDGRYLWNTEITDKGVSTLWGVPVINPAYMPSIAANSYPVFYGDLGSAYAIRDRAGMSVIRLTELYRNYDQVGFQIKKRVGGGVIMPEAIIPLKIAVNP